MAMKPTATKNQKAAAAELQRVLDGKTEQISRHFEAIRSEVAALASPESVLRHPLTKTGGALVAGILVGMIAGGLSRRSAAREEILDVVGSHVERALGQSLGAGAGPNSPKGSEAMSRLLGRLMPVAIDLGLAALGRFAERENGQD